MIKYISILPITLYLIYIVKKYGVQKSISDSYYRLSKGEKYLFFFALVGTSLSFILGWIIKHPTGKLSNILIFLAGSFICFVGAASEFKGRKLTETVHYIGATGGYILGYAFIVSVYKWDSLWFIIPSLLLIGLAKHHYSRVDNAEYHTTFTYNYVSNESRMIHKPKNAFIWWAEIIGFVTIYLATIL